MDIEEEHPKPYPVNSFEMNDVRGKDNIPPYRFLPSRRRVLAVMLGAFCVAVLSLIVVIVILLVQQKAAISSLEERLQVLRVTVLTGNKAPTKDGSSHETKSVQPLVRTSKHSRIKSNDEGEEVGSGDMDKDSIQFFTKLLKKLTNVSSKNTRAFIESMVSKFDLVQKDIRGLKYSLDDIQTTLNVSRTAAAAVHDTGETSCFANACVSQLNNITNEVLTSVSRLATAMTRNSCSTAAELVDKFEHFEKIVTRVDSNLTLTTEFITAIDGNLKSLHEKIVSADSKLTYLNATFQEVMQDRQKGLVHCAVGSEQARLQGEGKEIPGDVSTTSETPFPRCTDSQTTFNGSKGKESMRNNYATICLHKRGCYSHKIKPRSCYKISQTNEPSLPWCVAKRRCEDFGGYLAEINDVSEINFLEEHVDPQANYWLGGNDLESEGDWVWQHSGQQIKLGAWAGVEPNNLGQEHCLYSYQGILLWHDGPCSRYYRYICEKDDGEC